MQLHFFQYQKTQNDGKPFPGSNAIAFFTNTRRQKMMVNIPLPKNYTQGSMLSELAPLGSSPGTWGGPAGIVKAQKL